MAIHPSILAWRSLWTEEPGGESMASESDTAVQLSTLKHAVSRNSNLSLTGGTAAGGVITSGGDGGGKRVPAGGRHPRGRRASPGLFSDSGEAVLQAPHCDLG